MGSSAPSLKMLGVAVPCVWDPGGTREGLGLPAAKGQDSHLSPEEAVGLVREGTPGHKRVVHHQTQTLPSPSVQGSPSAPLSQRHPQVPFAVLRAGWKGSLLSPRCAIAVSRLNLSETFLQLLLRGS